MNKRLKYLVSSVFSALGFFMFISLPYESRYYGLMAGTVLSMFCFWFGLGIVFIENFSVRMMAVILPMLFFVGFGLFAVLLPYSIWLTVLLSVFFGLVYYILFLVENVFLVAIGYRTVPLYRAAYTTSLIVLLLTAFFVFDTLFSFRLFYWWNVLGVFFISGLIFMYQFWAITIELSDDGKDKNRWLYVFLPAVLMTELALVWSFWPVGIFKGSVYLVSVIYVLSGLIQAEIRERLFKRTWLTQLWIGTAIVVACILVTKWR